MRSMPRRAGISVKNSSSSLPRPRPWRTSGPGSTARSWSRRKGCIDPKPGSGRRGRTVRRWSVIDDRRLACRTNRTRRSDSHVDRGPPAPTRAGLLDCRDVDPADRVLDRPLDVAGFRGQRCEIGPRRLDRIGPGPGWSAIAPREFLTGLRKLGPPPHLPDLSANGLEIGHVSFVLRGDGQPGAIHVGYANDSGCRISLWITSAGVPGTGPLVEQHRGVAFSWRVDGLRYIIVRSGMRQERFHLLAESARAITLARARLHGPKRTALAVSAMFGRPCTS